MKKISINEIAKEAGVSKSTVSRVINNHPNVNDITRRNVLEVIERLHYKPSDIARNLSKSMSNDVAVSLPNIKNPFFSTIITEVMADAIASDMNILLYTTDSLNEDVVKKKEKKIIEMANKKRAGAMLLYSSWYTREMEEELKKLGIPVILIGKRVVDTDFYQIVYSEEKMAYLGMKYLLKQGYRKIGFIKWHESEDWRYSHRIQGVKRAMEEYGVTLDKNLLFNCGDYKISDDHAKAAYVTAKREIVDNDEVEAVFALTNTATLGLIKALKEAGRKLPIISFDDAQIFEDLDLGVTCIERSSEVIGELCVELLARVFRGEQLEEKVVEFEPQLVLRGSEKGIKF